MYEVRSVDDIWFTYAINAHIVIPLVLPMYTLHFIILHPITGLFRST